MRNLFIDDERFPNYDADIVRSSQEAIQYIQTNGMPDFISFDHDLGGDDTAMIVVDWIINSYLDNQLKIKDDFRFGVHSQNPIGKKNIEVKLNRFLDLFIK